jgi:dephospho-CoA kinase
MYLVGITGGIGSGKSLVCRILEILGVPVYHADQQARNLMNSQPGLVSRIRMLLGDDAYRDGMMDRNYVAGKVFGNKELLESLNRIVHPAVRQDFQHWAWKQEGVPYVVEEAAILFESGADRFMDYTVLVYAPEDIRIGRVMERDGTDREAVILRMSHQMDEEEKKQKAGEIILNDDTTLLLPQVIRLHEKMKKQVN